MYLVSEDLSPAAARVLRNEGLRFSAIPVETRVRELSIEKKMA